MQNDSGFTRKYQPRPISKVQAQKEKARSLSRTPFLTVSTNDVHAAHIRKLT